MQCQVVSVMHKSDGRTVAFVMVPDGRVGSVVSSEPVRRGEAELRPSLHLFNGKWQASVRLAQEAPDGTDA